MIIFIILTLYCCRRRGASQQDRSRALEGRGWGRGRGRGNLWVIVVRVFEPVFRMVSHALIFASSICRVPRKLFEHEAARPRFRLIVFTAF